jgi:protein arginine kinase
MLETLLEKKALWLSGDGPEADIVVESGGYLTRNLADLPFPGQASDDELHAVLERVLGAMEGHSIFRSGQFFMIEHLEPRVIRFLAERGLISPEMERAHGPRGVWVSDDQAFSAMVNGRDHVRLQVRSSGFNVDEVWSKLSHADDLLANALDFAFHDKYGYLSAAVAEVGTGFRLFATMHLAGLAMSNRMVSESEKAGESGHRIEGLFGSVSEGLGEVFTVSNTATLGRSEEEIQFNLRHLVSALLESERQSRSHLLSEGTRVLEDRVGRAAGVARGAHLLEFSEGLRLLSSLRLGRALGRLKEYSYKQLNHVLYASQPAHLAMRLNQECDELTLSMERANLFRKTFA